MVDDLKNRLYAIKPVMCGRGVNTRAVLQYLIYHKQLWRFKNYSSESIPFTPIEVIRGDHKTPPRKRDTVVVVHNDEERVGFITWIDRELEEAHVAYFKSNDTDTFPVDLFETNRGKIRWRIET